MSDVLGFEGISIHALVKRATDGFVKWVDWEKISIHALVKRATYGGINNVQVP